MSGFVAGLWLSSTVRGWVERDSEPQREAAGAGASWRTYNSLGVQPKQGLSYTMAQRIAMCFGATIRVC